MPSISSASRGRLGHEQVPRGPRALACFLTIVGENAVPDVAVPFRDHEEYNPMRPNIFRLLIISALTGGTLLVAQSLGQAGPPGSADAASPHTAVIDLVRVFNECAQITDLNELIRRKESELQTEAEQRRKVIELKQVELGAFRPGTADFEARRNDLRRLNIDANVWLKISEQDLEREKFEWTRVIYENTIKATGKISQEMGFDLVLQSKPSSRSSESYRCPASARLREDGLDTSKSRVDHGRLLAF